MQLSNVDPSLYNHDLAPIPQEKRSWGTYNYASLWVAMSVCIPTYMLASGLIAGGMLSALAGVVQSAKIGSGQPDIGAVFLLPAFAAAFLGASAIRPGRFNPLGTVVGVYLVATGFTGLVLLGVDIWIQPIFYALVLLIAISAPRLAESIRARGELNAALKKVRAEAPES